MTPILAALATRCACGAEKPCETWLCPGCEQQRPFCEGCSDALFPICDHCWYTVRQALRPGAEEERIRQAAAEAAGQLRLLAEPAPPMFARLFVWLPAAAVQKEQNELPWSPFDAPLWRLGAAAPPAAGTAEGATP